MKTHSSGTWNPQCLCWIFISHRWTGAQAHSYPKSQAKRELGVRPKFHSQSPGFQQMLSTAPSLPPRFSASSLLPQTQESKPLAPPSSDPGFRDPSPLPKFYSSTRKEEQTGGALSSRLRLPLPCSAPQNRGRLSYWVRRCLPSWGLGASQGLQAPPPFLPAV